jgi:23S rRNA (cytosine1962-C5)-methyltransferase
MKRIILRRGEEGRILQGHPWVYDNEVDRVLSRHETADGGACFEPGECADVESERKEYLGRAIVNPHSKIIARIYSPSKEGMDKGFFKRRFREALQRRAGFRDLSRESARIVFAEADFLPGLIIDRFTGWPLADIDNLCLARCGPRCPDEHEMEFREAAARRPLAFDSVLTALGSPQSWLSIQFLAWGMDCRREMIVEALEEVLDAICGSPAGIIEKSNVKVRELEGLPLREELLRGNFPAAGIVIFENGLPFAVNLPEGQKTGHFLDQRDNRLLAGKFAAGLWAEAGGGSNPLRVLDACSYTGGFGIHVLRATEQAMVSAVDASATALEGLWKNAALNGVEDRLTAIEADVFDALSNAERKKEKFDMIILDPPAFAKSRTVLTGALRGYKEINLRAIRLLRPGGILVTCSCSQALNEDRFKRMIAGAAADAKRRIYQLDFRCQGPDHPVLIGYDESLYLKCGFYRVL